MIRKLPYIAIFTFLLSACAGNEKDDFIKQDELGFSGEINAPGPELVDEGEYRVYPLPTPLQLTSVLKAYDLPFREDLLISHQDVQHHSQVDRALNLGCTTIDMGYTAIYGSNQNSLKYLKSSHELMMEMGLHHPVEDGLIQRYESNISNVDSLSQIILETYELTHNHFQQAHKEGMGLLILSGCYIEGLYLVTSMNEEMDETVLINLLGQQKLFLESILELLEYYINAPEIKSFRGIMQDLDKHFNNVLSNYDPATKQLTSEFKHKSFAKLKAKVTEVRNTITQR